MYVEMALGLVKGSQGRQMQFSTFGGKIKDSKREKAKRVFPADSKYLIE